ncbi:hypothetical protein FHW36_1011209 [Chitinophaga polysaccharea]|uniref:Uncharacterized protein n=1 Tax=Chitinophaga polysaccharea TaxID=1293035 RepID=A0A561Q4H8_9BACT|nr:hypothetical protein FHW36_1011209 [Chitinophaga polysaccharea]
MIVVAKNKGNEGYEAMPDVRFHRNYFRLPFSLADSFLIKVLD